MSRIVILLVDALESAEQDEDLERERIPYDVHRHYDDVLEITRACVDPVNGIRAEHSEQVVDDTCGNDVLSGCSDIDPYHVEHSCENHTDSDGVRNIGQEEYGLQSLLQGLDRIKTYRDKKREHGRDRYRKNTEENSVLKAVYKVLVFNYFYEILRVELERSSADRFETAVIFEECHSYGIDNGPDREYQQQYDGGGEVYPRLPLLFTVNHQSHLKNKVFLPFHGQRYRACWA